MEERPGFRLIILKTPEEGNSPHGVVAIETNCEGFGFWMMACEYLLHKTAQRSSAGYEKSLELLCRGAMTWRDRENADA